jgi:acrylyl-CoA reductase (NADPH)
MSTFRALQIVKDGEAQRAQFVTLTEDDLMDGDVTIDVTHSSVNYKDGLAVTGKAPIIRAFPLIPGIDLAGKIRTSRHSRWNTGDSVIVNGWGMGEAHNGGYAEMARVKAEWLTAQPAGFTPAEAMAIGVAGFTAMLCVMALEEQHITPERGAILVTGAAGGVGSIAVALLAKLGYSVTASTGRLDETPYLQGLGATAVIDRSSFSGPVKPLAKPRWAGAIDNVGSTTLAHVLSQIAPEGAVAACGLAQGMDLPTSVAPFILRGVRLIGINSVSVPEARRQAAWQRLKADLPTATLHAVTTTIGLADIPATAQAIVAGQVRGRVVVDVRK